MEPRIQYARTADGVSIAFFELGEGTPFIQVPPIPFSHLSAQWADARYRTWFERLAEHCRLIVLDSRGCGLSDRDVDDHSLEGYMRDVDAVAAKLGLDRFALAGICASGPVAAAYAGTHADRVSHLTLWCTASRGMDVRKSSPALGLLLQHEWSMFTETVAHAMVAGWDDPAAARGFATILRAGTNAAHLDRFEAISTGLDATPYLERIAAPTLILHRKEAAIWPVEEGRKLAARIPNATMTLLEGGALLPYLDMERSLAAIFDLLGVTPSSRSEGRERPLLDERELSGVTEVGGQAAISGPQSAGLRIILFTDLEGHTPMMQRLGDERGRQVLRAHERLTRAALREHGGHEVKTIGDGFMASFASAQRALNCALALQRSFAAYNADPESAEPLRVRVGINAGEPIAEDGDLFGNAVIAASRIASLCHGGEILVANVVRELTAGKGFLFADRGDYALRGFEDPMRIWELRWS